MMVDGKNKFKLPAVFIGGIAVLIAVTAFFVIRSGQLERYEMSFYDIFDTYSSVTIYASNEKAANAVFDDVREELRRLNKLYDIYNNYEGINNIKTINDNAGVEPVKIDDDLMELLEFSVKAYDETDGAVNPAMGSVLSIWHSYREAGTDNPQTAALPSDEELKEAAAHTDINALVLDKQNGTAYIGDPKVKLDVGAVAKGFAADKAMEVIKGHGVQNAMLNMGGNVLTMGGKPDNKEWGVAVQNPRDSSQNSAFVTINDGAVVTSGDYQRYYEVNGVRYSHIIDGETLFPPTRYASVTVATDSSAIADMLSTALFILPEEQGNALALKYDAHICRIYGDGTISSDDFYKIR
jgi:thiamine biosynthesis lipoprotein